MKHNNFPNTDTNCQDISEIKEYLKITENLLDSQHYLSLIAKRYLIQLYQKGNMDRTKYTNDETGQDDDEAEQQVDNKVSD